MKRPQQYFPTPFSLTKEAFQPRGREATLTSTAYRRYGYRLHEIAAHLGVHYATVSLRLRQAEDKMHGFKT